MKIQKTSEYKFSPKLNILLYGEPKVGKSFFCTTAPNPLIADAESGYRYMSQNNIDIPIAEIETWEDMIDFYKESLKSNYETIIIDPVNELLEKLIKSAKINRLYIQSTDKDALSMRGWGYVKGKMREMLKAFRDLNKNVIFVAHTKTEEKNGINKIGPKLDANLSQDFMAMMDIIGYMAIMNEGKEVKRMISFKPDMNYEAGSRIKGLPEMYDASKGFKELFNLVIQDKIFIKSKELDEKIKQNEDKFNESLKQITKEELNPASV